MQLRQRRLIRAIKGSGACVLQEENGCDYSDYMDVSTFLMAQVVLFNSVFGNTRVHEEVTDNNFTGETCGFLSTDFCCFLGETKT